MTTTLDEMLLPTTEVEIQAAGGKLPTVSIVAYSGGLMNVPGWGPLVIDLAGLDFSASQIGSTRRNVPHSGDFNEFPCRRKTGDGRHPGFV